MGIGQIKVSNSPSITLLLQQNQNPLNTIAFLKAPKNELRQIRIVQKCVQIQNDVTIPCKPKGLH